MLGYTRLTRHSNYIQWVILFIMVFLLAMEIRTRYWCHEEVLQECCFEPPCDLGTEKECQTDFVVIGVGTAGALVVTQLSEPRDGSFARSFAVVGLELGEYRNDDIEVNSVANFEFLVPSTSPRWSANFAALPDPGLLGAQPRIQYGRMLGGCGNHNEAYVVHPSPRLLDEDWVPIGGPAWSSASITAIINNFENFHGITTSPRGTSGPLQVQQIDPDPNTSSFGNRLFAALLTYLPGDANTPIVDDYNGGYETSISNKAQFLWRAEVDTTLRSSTGLDYTTPSVVSDRGYGVNGRKLRIKFRALVDKILFDNHRRAYAVQYTVDGVTMIVHARKRIILSANSINSPAILQRSGYGNESLLSSLGIQVVYDNPDVGNNLQSHVGSAFMAATNSSTVFGFPTQQAHISVLPEMDGRRLVQLLASPLLASAAVGGGSPALDNFIGLSTLPQGWSSYGIFGAVVHPASRGTVKITSREPSVEPIVYSGFYSDPTNRDLRALRQTWRSLYNALKALQTSDPTNGYSQLYPPESAFLSGIDSDLDPYIKGLPFYHDHWLGTCSMGTVVDGDLSLVGVKGVTIADLSGAPVINDGNTATMATFMAQRAVDVLLAMFTV